MQFVDKKHHMVVVVDPSHETHPVVERAAAMAKQAEDPRDFTITVLIISEAKPVDTPFQSHLVRDDEWMIDAVKKSFRTAGAYFTVKYCWLPKTAQTLLDICKEEEATILGIPYHNGESTEPLSEENWKLLRASPIPVLIAHDEQLVPAGSILSAIKFQDNAYTEPNDAVLSAGMELSSLFHLDHHVVNAYSDSLEFPDRTKIANKANVSSDRVHISMGSPEDVICDAAQEVDAELVLIANQRRKGLRARIRGNTVEKILLRVKRDILMI